MSKQLYFTSLLIFSTLLFSCKKDLVDPYENAGNTSSVVSTNAILVQTVDQNGNAIAGVSVSLEGTIKTSDANGVAQFSSMSLPSINSTIVSTKAGYFKNQTVISPIENDELSVVITLSTATTVDVNASNGGRVDCENGGYIEFPADGFLTLGGQTYDGNVNVAAKFIDPATSTNNKIIPNNFSGVNEKGEEVFVENHGMLLVELTDDSGNEILVNPDNKAELHIPVTANDASDPENKLPLYYFHEGYGKWIEDGQVKLKDGEYVGEVSHFTFWMCPYVYDHHFLSGQFQCMGTNYSGATVNVYNEWGYLLGSVTTNVAGGWSGSIPGTITHTLEVEDPCGGVIYSETIGPFSAATNLGAIDLCSGTSVNYGIVEGTVVDCNNDPETAAYVRVQFDGWSKYMPANISGAFNQAVIFCSNSTDAKFMGINQGDLTASAEVTLPISASMNFGELQVCDTPDEYCAFTLSGNDYYYIPNASTTFYCKLNFSSIPQNQVTVSTSSPNQTRFWIGGFNPNVGSHIIPGGPFTFSFELFGGQAGEQLEFEITSLGTAVGEYVEGTIAITQTYEDGWFNGGSTIGSSTFRFMIDEYVP
jgi:hypothetical protein